MCTWFCETFCCFLLRFHHRHNHLAGQDEGLESGDSIYALPDPPRRAYQQHHRRPDLPHSRPIELSTIYPGASPSSSTFSSSPRGTTRFPPRTAPPSVPLPVRYPQSETPTGKNFGFNNKSTANRMKPLPPLRTTFDGGGDVVRGTAGKASASAEKSMTRSGGSNNTSSNTPALTYGSAVSSSGAPSASAASVPGMGLPLAQELDKPFHVE
ncbi:MAG: hypothetical protein Q9212_000733, partial [Teloschistes hypoglaucus]